MGWAWVIILGAAVIYPLFEPVRAFFKPALDAVGRFFEWLFTPLSWLLEWIGSLLPEINIPWPRLVLPELPDLPEPPAWLEWLMEHPKLWFPIVLATFIGVISFLRANRAMKVRHQQMKTTSMPEISSGSPRREAALESFGDVLDDAHDPGDHELEGDGGEQHSRESS